MITEAFLAAILGSQWALNQRMGVKMDDVLEALKDPRMQVYLNQSTQGLPASAVDEGITPYTRKVIDLTSARDYEEQSVTGQWLAVESCTGVDIAAYINTKNPLPDPVYLDRMSGISYPFQRLYLKHSAQTGKQLVLLVGRNGLRVEPSNTSMLRWGIPREPVWEHGAVETAPAALTDLVTWTVSTGKKGRVFGFHLSAGEANEFSLNVDATEYTRYHLGSANPIDVVFPKPIVDDIAAGGIVAIKNVTAAAAGITYQSSLLRDEG